MISTKPKTLIVLLYALLSTAFIVYLFNLKVSYKINFIRSVHIGDKYNAKLISNYSSKYKIMAIGNNYAAKQNSQHICLTGKLSISKVTEYASPAKSSFYVSSFDGKLNDLNVESKLSGKVISIDQEKTPAKISSKDYLLSKNELSLLSLLFKPSQKESLNDFAGTDQRISIGETWTPPKKHIRENLNKMGLKVEENEIKGKAQLIAISTFNNIKCYCIKLMFNTDLSKPDYFNFNATIYLPIKSRIHSVYYTRNILFKKTRSLPTANPLYSGKTISTEIQLFSEVELIPIKL